MFRVKGNRIITEELYRHEEAIKWEETNKWMKSILFGVPAGLYVGMAYEMIFGNFRHISETTDEPAVKFCALLGIIIYRITPKWGKVIIFLILAWNTLLFTFYLMGI